MLEATSSSHDEFSTASRRDGSRSAPVLAAAASSALNFLPVQIDWLYRTGACGSRNVPSCRSRWRPVRLRESSSTSRNHRLRLSLRLRSSPSTQMFCICGRHR